MKKATATIVLDKRRIKNDNTYPVILRIYFNRKKRIYQTGVFLELDSFEKITTKGVKIPMELKKIKSSLQKKETIANRVIESLDIFSFDAFESSYFTNRDAYSNVYTAFENYIKLLELENRFSTAESYKNAMLSLKAFKRDLQFADIDKLFLTKYEKWMEKNKKSISTTGIYLRSLRRIYNLQNGIDASLYPFGSKDNQYTIPTSKNIKKALKSKDIALIHHAELTGSLEMYRDLWIFLFLANGMNVVDMCNLRYSDIDNTNNKIYFEREKTKGRSKVKVKTMIDYSDPLKDIINKHGVKSINKDAYIFPFFHEGMSDKEKHDTRKQLTQNINKNMRRLAKQLNIDSPISTMVARHSFATTLKRAEVSTATISEMMAHTSVETTKNYLDSLDSEAIEKASKHVQNVLNINNA